MTYIRDAGLCSGGDQPVVVVGRGHDGHGDDEVLLSLESVDDGFFIVVVDLGDLDALGEGAGASNAGEGRDGVFSGCEEGFRDGFAYVAAGLWLELV